MRNTPLDDPAGSAREGDQSSSEEAGADGLGGLVHRACAALARTGAALRRLFRPADSAVTEPDQDVAQETSGRHSAPEPVGKSMTTADRESRPNRPVLADRTDEKPVPAATAEKSQDRPELVARWHDDKLTLSEPNKAGAEISSDTWSEVDP